MPATLEILDCSQRRALAADQFDVIDVPIQFPATSHASLRLGLSNCRESQSSFCNNERAIHDDVILNLKVHRVAHMCIG